MARFRKRPVEVEAVRFDTSGPHKMVLPPGVQGVPSPSADNWNYEGCLFFVTTTQGHLALVERGDWIITEPDGAHHYPCKPDIFEATYEAVSAETEDDDAPKSRGFADNIINWGPSGG
jgi:hypothetical protein